MTRKPTHGWHICWSRHEGEAPQLSYEDRRTIRVGETLIVPPPIEVAMHGLHFCSKLQNALRLAYAGDNFSSWVCRVKVGGVVQSSDIYIADDIWAGSSRTVLEMKPLRPIIKALTKRATWLLGFVPSSFGNENYYWQQVQMQAERVLTMEPKQYGFAPEHAFSYMLAYMKDTAAVKFGHGDHATAYLKWKDGFERRLVKLFKQQGA